MRIFLLTIFLFLASCKSNETVSRPAGTTLVVLGFPANDDGTPSNLMKYRLDKALSLFRKEKVSYIIVTGGAVQNSYAEADVMKDYLMKKGIRKDMIIAETRAKSTFGNAMFTSRILKELNVDDPIIVTSEEHEERAGKIFSLFVPKYRLPQ